MMFIKLERGTPDDYVQYEVSNFNVTRNSSGVHLTADLVGGRAINIDLKEDWIAYIMNGDGRTIDKVRCRNVQVQEAMLKITS